MEVDGTSGLWSLVTDKDHDGCNDALYQGFDRHTRYLRSSRSKTWTKILRPIWNEIQFTDFNSEDTDNSGDNEEYCDPAPRKVESEKTE